MKNKYVVPEIEFLRICSTDIVTSSGAGTGSAYITKGIVDGDENELVEYYEFHKKNVMISHQTA